MQAVSGRAAQIFSELDTNKDGLLTADEISADRRSFFDHLVRVGDKDKDGSLTKAEFIAGLAPEKAEPAPKEDSNPSATGRPRFDPDTFFRRIDRNGDGQLSMEELPEPIRVRAVAALQELGRDKNGTLSLEEFRKHVGMRPRSMDMPGGPPEVPAFFRKLDRNGDGKLSRSELSSAAQALDELDIDRDGEIGLGEFFGRPGSRGEARPAPTTGAGTIEKSPGAKAAGDKSGKGEPPRVVVPAADPDGAASKGRPAGAFKRFDVDGDGKVSREEAPPNLKRNFQKLDTNGDGYLDPVELRKALEQFRSSGPKAPKA